MRILVTGGAGFQGGHLVEFLLAQGHEVAILDTWSDISERNVKMLGKEVRVIWGSITDAEIVEKSLRGQDTVFHLAARINVDESIREPDAYIEVNVKGTHNVLKSATKYNIRMIHASTCEVYGAPVAGGLIDETTELRPHSPYAASKAAAERLCFAYYKTFGTNVTIVRPFNIYGERQKEGQGGAVIAIFVKRALEGKPLKLFGEGSQTRDYMHVTDLVRAYDLVLQRNDLAGETINFGTGKETSIKEIAEFVAEKLGAKIEYDEARPGEVERFACDVSKARQLGFEPTVEIWDGIARYINWRSQLLDTDYGIKKMSNFRDGGSFREAGGVKNDRQEETAGGNVLEEVTGKGNERTQEGEFERSEFTRGML